ncbi:MAG: hypothetical protein ABI210_10945 [Abditibacteriaceae bacterium]
MGAGLVFFFWLILAGIYGFFWLIFLTLFIVGKIKKSRVLSWIGGVPLTLSTVFAVIFLGAIVCGIVYVSFPSNVYKMTFGTSPTVDVTGLRSHYWYFADSGVTYLKFKAAPTTIKKITAKTWHQLTGQKIDEENFNYTEDDDIPSWWHPKKTPSTQIYKNSSLPHDFAAEDEMLIYNPNTQQAYYEFEGID